MISQWQGGDITNSNRSGEELAIECDEEILNKKEGGLKVRPFPFSLVLDDDGACTALKNQRRGT